MLGFCRSSHNYSFVAGNTVDRKVTASIRTKSWNMVTCIFYKFKASMEWRINGLMATATIRVVIYEGLNFVLFWICYNLEIFVDIKFHGCRILWIFVFKLCMDTTRYQRPPCIGTYIATWPDFTVWKGKQQHVWPFYSFCCQWWRNCGQRAVKDFSCMCTVFVAWWVILCKVTGDQVFSKGKFL